MPRLTISPEQPTIVLPVTFVGPKSSLTIPMVLDTGATFTIASYETLIFIGYDPTSYRRRVGIVTASGMEYMSMIPVAQVECLGCKVSNLLTACHDLPDQFGAEGLLGLNFLKQFDILLKFRSNELEIV